ncbi:hypothetical protein N7492_002516 [Penicillium capsulatum]|uniref:Uncharacterized protein n=1 Tax=Penicillium capsulatum TaxID=69766 RepID=A0A9W9LVA0_9EURO|nr:hypothetical protein N7492_002516 [Penicillium capsulatum]KAJ6122880.1 hypothetical protein N7512_005345 [Penicillium capsulatum]
MALKIKTMAAVEILIPGTIKAKTIKAKPTKAKTIKAITTIKTANTQIVEIAQNQFAQNHQNSQHLNGPSQNGQYIHNQHDRNRNFHYNGGNRITKQNNFHRRGSFHHDPQLPPLRFIQTEPMLYDCDMDVEMTDAPPLDSEQLSRYPTWQDLAANTADLRSILNNTASGAIDVWAVLAEAHHRLASLENRIHNYNINYGNLH